jgi:23S rRNA pseudouridine1911/1915/1917 synthase
LDESRRALQVDQPWPRLDRYVSELSLVASRSQAQRLIRDGSITVNGLITKPGTPLNAGDVVEIVGMGTQTVAEAATTTNPPAFRLLYEDADLLVLDKPAGLAVHGAPGIRVPTLVDQLLAHRPDLGQAGMDPIRPGIVHRLDRDTTGVLVVAANAKTLAALQAQFKARSVDKRYQALLAGHLTPEIGAIEAPIGRHPADRKRMAVLANGGRYARTEYQMIAYLGADSWVEARLMTGRTHQLRVHFGAIGYPILGDATYGGSAARRAPRQMLHAWRLTLVHPTLGSTIEFEAELPDDMQRVIERLKGRVSQD